MSPPTGARVRSRLLEVVPESEAVRQAQRIEEDRIRATVAVTRSERARTTRDRRLLVEHVVNLHVQRQAGRRSLPERVGTVQVEQEVRRHVVVLHRVEAVELQVGGQIVAREDLLED